MPDHIELEEITENFLDEKDTSARRARTLIWGKRMEPTQESDEEDERGEES